MKNRKMIAQLCIVVLVVASLSMLVGGAKGGTDGCSKWRMSTCSPPPPPTR